MHSDSGSSPSYNRLISAVAAVAASVLSEHCSTHSAQKLQCFGNWVLDQAMHGSKQWLVSSVQLVPLRLTRNDALIRRAVLQVGRTHVTPIRCSEVVFEAGRPVPDFNLTAVLIGNDEVSSRQARAVGQRVIRHERFLSHACMHSGNRLVGAGVVTSHFSRTPLVYPAVGSFVACLHLREGYSHSLTLR